MKKEIKINGKIFIAQTTYYVFKDEDSLQNDSPSLITSDKNLFDRHKRNEKHKGVLKYRK